MAVWLKRSIAAEAKAEADREVRVGVEARLADIADSVDGEICATDLLGQAEHGAAEPLLSRTAG